MEVVFWYTPLSFFLTILSFLFVIPSEGATAMRRGPAMAGEESISRQKEGWESTHLRTTHQGESNSVLGNGAETLFDCPCVRRKSKMTTPTFPQMQHFFALVAEGKVTTENLQKFLGNPSGFVKENPNLLTLTGTIKVRLARKFIARKFFTMENASVAIAYVGENFAASFLRKTEERADSEISLRYHTLARASVDGPIIAELGGEAKAETTLAEIAALMTKQAHGEPGALLTNGYANIFYVRNAVGVVCAVDLYWCSDGWIVGARSVAGPNAWNAGCRVFSRDS